MCEFTFSGITSAPLKTVLTIAWLQENKKICTRLLFTHSSIFAKHQFRWCGQYLVTILKRFLLCLKRLCSRTLWQWGHKKNSKSYHPVLASLWAATEKPKSVEAGRRYSTWVLRSILKHCTTPMAIHSKALKIKVFILLAFLMDTVHKIKKWLH